MAARSAPPSSRGGAQLVWMRFSAARECAPSPRSTRARKRTGRSDACGAVVNSGSLNRGNHKTHSRYFLNYLRKSPRCPCADLQLWQNSRSVVEPSRSSSPFQAHWSVTVETTRENAANAERFRNGKCGVVRYQFSHVVGPQAHCPLAFSYRLGGIGEDGGTRGGGRARVR